MSTFRCHCGRFLSNVTARIREDWLGGHIERVLGDCRQHGHVEEAGGDWMWEDFDPEYKESG